MAHQGEKKKLFVASHPSLTLLLLLTMEINISAHYQPICMGCNMTIRKIYSKPRSKYVKRQQWHQTHRVLEEMERYLKNSWQTDQHIIVGSQLSRPLIPLLCPLSTVYYIKLLKHLKDSHASCNFLCFLPLGGRLHQ